MNFEDIGGQGGQGGPRGDIRENKGTNLYPKSVPPFSRALEKSSQLRTLEDMCQDRVAAGGCEGLEVGPGDPPVTAQAQCRQMSGRDPAPHGLGANAEGVRNLFHGQEGGVGGEGEVSHCPPPCLRICNGLQTRLWQPLGRGGGPAQAKAREWRSRAKLAREQKTHTASVSSFFRNRTW